MTAAWMAWGQWAVAAVAAIGTPPGPHPRPPPAPMVSMDDWRAALERDVARRLAVPVEEQAVYEALAGRALRDAGREPTRPQWVLVVDRQAHVQAALLFLAQPAPQAWQFLGATPVSTGRPGGFEHFLTPLGVHEHHPRNPDFRAEGTRNARGIRGYGVAGMRVFDFGWVDGERTWGAGGTGRMRLQLHATDPQRLEPRLGLRESKGCVRIPAALNRFLDQHGLLDAAYDEAAAEGRRHWVIAPDHQPTPWAGRFMVVLETARPARPAWSPAPGRAPALAGQPHAGAC